MADDVLLAKAAIIERCLGRIDQEYRGRERELETNYTQQDAIVLNPQRACEAAIDGAMRVVRVRRLGLPQESRDAFRMLQKAALLDPQLGAAMLRMVGFRNVAVHNYRELSVEILRSILDNRLNDLRQFAQLLIRLS